MTCVSCGLIKLQGTAVVLVAQVPGPVAVNL